MWEAVETKVEKTRVVKVKRIEEETAKFEEEAKKLVFQRFYKYIHK